MDRLSRVQLAFLIKSMVDNDPLLRQYGPYEKVTCNDVRGIESTVLTLHVTDDDRLKRLASLQGVCRVDTIHRSISFTFPRRSPQALLAQDIAIIFRDRWPRAPESLD